MDIKRKTVIVTGANGFLGKHICRVLREQKAYVIPVVREECNLTNYSDVLAYFAYAAPIDYLIHCAAVSGNVKFNNDNAALVSTENTVMNAFVVKAAHRVRVKKFIGILSSCAFDSNFEVISPEHIRSGKPHESIKAFGNSKRYLYELLQHYKSQYNFPSICISPTGLYGEGCKFDLERNKVLESLVKRVVDANSAGQEGITLWGSGKPKREFIYVRDAANLIVEAVSEYNDTENPLLLGTKDEYSIGTLVEKIADNVGYDGVIDWDVSKPDGQMRKKLSTTQVEQYFPNYKFTPFSTGLSRLIESYYKYRITKGERCSSSASLSTV